MSTLLEAVSSHHPATAAGDSLVLVQDQQVIATYAAHQDEAALDLARVICRAIGHPVEIFRVRQDQAGTLQAGVVAPVHERGWRRFAYAGCTRFGAVQLVLAGEPADQPMGG